MEEIFAEISEYVHNPEEVVGMFSEALKIMDDNMYHYMADQYQAKVERQQAEIENLQMESQKLYQTLIEQLKKNDSTKESAILEFAAICESEEIAKDLVEKYW